MSHFLLGGGGFQGIIRDFGRPTVQQWTGVAHFEGPAGAASADPAAPTDAAPTAASRRLLPVPADADGGGTGLAAWIDDAVTAAAQLAQRGGVHSVALAVDVNHWRLLEFTLWEAAVPDDLPADERYEVLHLSAPEASALPKGRCW